MPEPISLETPESKLHSMGSDIQHSVFPLSNSLIQSTPGLLEKITHNCCSNNQDATALVVEMVKFLSLVGHSKEFLTPSLIVDMAWHEFILFTRAYDKFCQQQFGRFIHHQPEDNKTINQQRYYRTLELYYKTFGDINSLFWTNNYNPCGSCEAGSL